MKSILVSACLLGKPCRFDGKSKPCPAVLAISSRYTLIPVCPEVLGGLPTPRTPSEIVGDRVLMQDGRDVTQNYHKGARRALECAIEHGCDTAILKERSPSCGCGKVYDGTFSRTLTDGNGITASLLLSHGLRVLGESELDRL